MKKKTIIIIFFAFSILSFSQTRIMVEQPCFDGLASYSTETTRIDSLKQLPTKIQFRINELLKKSLTDFVNDIQFINGQIIDVESLLEKDSILSIENDYIFPKYEVSFQLSDTTLGIKNYCIAIDLDQYGQILDFNWPREGYNKKTIFTNTSIAYRQAIKMAKKKKHKTKANLIGLNYDKKLNKLFWEISFLQKATGDNFFHEEEYQTFLIDAININNVSNIISIIQTTNSD